MSFFTYIEKYGLLIVLMYCFGIFTPELGVKILLNQFDTTNMLESKSSGDLFKQVFWLAIACAYFLIIKKKINNPKFIIVFKSMKIPLLGFLIILLLCLMTTLWAKFDMLSTKRVLFQLILLFVLYSSFVLCFLNNTLSKVFASLLIAIISMTALSILMGGGVNSSNELAGFFTTKNMMGAALSSAFLLAYLVFYHEGTVTKYRYLLSFIFILLLLTASKTSILLIVLFLVLSRLPKVISQGVVIICGFGFISLFIVLPLVSYSLDNYWHVGMLVEQDFMTARGLIWEVVYRQLYFSDKLYQGFGYGSFFGTPERLSLFEDKYSFLQFIHSAHNGYLDIFAQLGVLSLGVLFILFKLILNSSQTIYIAAATVPLIHNMSEPSFVNGQAIVWVLLVSIILLAYISKVNCKKNSQVV